MKKIFSFSVLIILFLISFSHTAEKMGYIDSEKIINGYKGISIIREQYSKLVSEWEKEAEDKIAWKYKFNRLIAKVELCF